MRIWLLLIFCEIVWRRRIFKGILRQVRLIIFAWLLGSIVAALSAGEDGAAQRCSHWLDGAEPRAY